MTPSRHIHAAVAAVWCSLAATALAAPSPELVLDTNDAVISRSSNVHGFFRLGTQALFTSSDGNSFKLWRTDGTANGTVTVRSGEHLNYFLLDGPVNGRLFMQVQDYTDNSFYLWSTDGTTAGTQSLFQISVQGQIGAFEPLGETANHRMLFWSSTPQGVLKLWSTDGTPAGTSSIAADFRVVSPAIGGFVIPPVVRGNVVIFQGRSLSTGVFEVWRTDGSSANTVRIVDTDPGTGPSGGIEQLLGVDDSYVYFMSQNDTTTGYEIWRHEITTGNTQLLIDFAPGTANNNVWWLEPVPGGVVFLTENTLWFVSSAGTGLTRLAQFNDIPTVVGHAGAHVLFKGRAVPDDGQELWTTDGTVAGTVRVRDHAPGNMDTNLYMGPKLAGDRVLVHLEAGEYQLWSTDGTPAGTRRIVATANATFGADAVYEVANEGNETRLWKIDPVTEAATWLPSPVNTVYPVALGGKALFTGFDPVTGVEPWVSDGTPAGTHLLLDVEPQTGNASGGVGKLTTVGGVAMFEAADDTHGAELWKTDGTAAGTSMVLDVRPGPTPATVQHPKVAGNEFYFQAFDGSGFSMWKSDGTAAGSAAVRDGVPTAFQFETEGSFSECKDWVASLGAVTLFATVTTDAHAQLWSTDGTAAGTRIVNAAAHPAGTGPICDLTTLGSLVYYRATLDGLPQLFRSDGTASGTFQLTGLAANSGWANPPVSLGARAYFLVDNGGTRLWSTDGTVNGTQPFTAGGNAGGLRVLTIIGVFKGALIVQLSSSPASVASLDVATGALTVLMDPGPATSASGGVVTGGRMFFSCADVCVTDGTAAGTRRVRETDVGIQRTGPLLAYNGGAYFIAHPAGTFGAELWKSDGTPAGTVRITADATGNSREITPPAIAGGRVMFGMSDPATGRELWRVVSAAPVAVADNATTTENVEVLIDLLANDVDSDGRLVADGLAIKTDPSNGTVTLDASGVAHYRPRANFTGPDTFTYRITDDSGASAEAVVTIRVDAAAQNPNKPGGGGGGRVDWLLLLMAAVICISRTHRRWSAPWTRE